MSSEQVVTPDAADPQGAAPPKRSMRNRWLLLLVAVIVIDIAAMFAFPPFPKGGQPGDACPFPACFIESSLEFPAVHTVIDFAPDTAPAATDLITLHPSISSTLLTMWIVMAIVLVGAILMTRGGTLVPGRAQNIFETIYEFLSDFGIGLAGPPARPYIPIFVGTFLLILFDNWIGLVPPVGKVDFLRAPSSDVNITIGMALVSFLIFQTEGFRHLGVGGYLGKFFPVYEFRNGIGAGIIAMFVGLIELMLEFVKPVTLSMRLFGNIYGGEVALGVITSLTIAIFPIGLLLLDGMLNAIQALIFSVLTLVFITLAIEGHGHEEGQIAAEAIDAVDGEGHRLQPAT
ncbi:MAG: F-type H+-transporting ATPase subunit a [Chloroflexota bacterium]|nr:F-type H+-transporting ATPase subunit a [Chloroflexota bacterium]